jgi:hypothetical protein
VEGRKNSTTEIGTRAGRRQTAKGGRQTRVAIARWKQDSRQCLLFKQEWIGGKGVWWLSCKCIEADIYLVLRQLTIYLYMIFLKIQEGFALIHPVFSQLNIFFFIKKNARDPVTQNLFYILSPSGG